MTNGNSQPGIMSQFAENIAKTLIWAFIIFVAAIIILSALGRASYDNIQIVGAIWGPWVGAVVGYYFGSKPTEPLINQNAMNSDRAARSEEKVNQAQKTMLQAKSLLQDSIKSVEIMKAKPESIQTSDLELMIRDLEMVIEKLNVSM